VRIGLVEGIGIALVLAGVVAAWILERRRRRRAEAMAREHEAQRGIVIQHHTLHACGLRMLGGGGRSRVDRRTGTQYGQHQGEEVSEKRACLAQQRSSRAVIGGSGPELRLWALDFGL